MKENSGAKLTKKVVFSVNVGTTHASSFEKLIIESLQKKLDETKDEYERGKIAEKIKTIDFGNVAMEAIKDISKSDLEICRDKMFETSCLTRALGNEFRSRQERKWNRAFAASETLYDMVLEAAEYYVAYISDMGCKEEYEQKQWRYLALRNIHGRGMQIYLEILELMKGGFADGAYARWRTLYELTIYGAFIADQDEKVARAFCEASKSEEEYPNWAKESGLFVSANGKEPKNITFSSIEQKTDLNTAVWNKHYKLACKTTHATPQGTFMRMCNYAIPGKETPYILVGRSDYGLTTPGEHSAISLVQLSVMFFSLFPEGLIVARMDTLNKWIDIVRQEYFTAHDEIFPDDEEKVAKMEPKADKR